MHDPRVGRFFAVDPLAPKYPHNSPYAFSENDVIASIELEGLEKYRVVGRSFAPLNAFTDTHFESEADGRTKFEIADYKEVSARIHVKIDIDLDEWKFKEDIASQETFLKGLSIPFGITNQKINLKTTGEKLEKDIRLKGDYIAKNGTNVGPPINIQFDIALDKDGKSLTIDTHLTGNVFPAQETMIFDEVGNGIFLGTSIAEGSPLTGVWGEGKGNTLTKETIRVNLNASGHFESVNWKMKTYTLEEYNKMFENLDVWDNQNSDRFKDDYKEEENKD